MAQDHEPTHLPIKNIKLAGGDQKGPPSAASPATGFAPAPSQEGPHNAPVAPKTGGKTFSFEFVSSGKQYWAEIGFGGDEGYTIQMFRAHGGSWKASGTRLGNPILGAFILNHALKAPFEAEVPDKKLPGMK